MAETDSITELQRAYAGGDRDAFDELVPLVYDELRLIARDHLRRTNRGATLDTTALVHEAYLKLAGQKDMRVEDRSEEETAQAIGDLASHGPAKLDARRAWIRSELSLKPRIENRGARPLDRTSLEVDDGVGGFCGNASAGRKT